MMEESLEAILALFRSDEPVTRETDWFTMRDAGCRCGPTRYPYRGRGGGHGLAVRAAPGRQVRRLAAVAVDVGRRRVRRDRQAWGVVEEGRRRRAATRPTGAPGGCSARCTSPRPGAGHRRLHARPGGLRELLRRWRRVRAARAAASTAGRNPSRVRRGVRGLGQRRHRDPRRRDRIRRGAARAVRRVRHVPDARPRLGRPRGDVRIIRLFAREVMPHFQLISAARASHDWATAKRGEIFGRAGQAIINAVT